MNNGSYPKKTGILGGTFNPIHKGHLMIAENAMHFCELERVVFIPSGCSYLKDSSIVADKKHRIRMTELATEGHDGFEVSTIETDRAGDSYTWITLDILCKDNPGTEFYYIVGADTLLFMENWKCPEKIFSKCTIVCAVRDEHSVDELYSKAESLKDRFGAEIILMDCPKIDISSSMIRDEIKQGSDCNAFLDDKVSAYIRDKGLYGNNKHR